MTRLRVLLVHANPFQRVLPVPPYGLERVRSAGLATGADIEILDPYLLSDRPRELAVETIARFRPDVIGLGLRIIDDSVVIERLDAPATEPTDIAWFLPEVRRLREAIGAAAPEALLVLGGATFSYVPREVLDYLDVDWGVVGPGEVAFAEVLRRRAAGQALDGIPGIVARGADVVPAGAIAPVSARSIEREGLYAPTSCFPVQTRIGCAMKCAYCLTAALGGRNRSDDPAGVVDEIEELVGHASRRGLMPVPLFFADDEFNLPGEDHAIGVLEGIVARGLQDAVQWRAYFNPVPFSPRLASLIARTNGHASITVDTASEAVMERNRKPFRLRHLRTTLECVEAHAVSSDLTFLFGLAGEDHDTIEETVGFLQRLPRSVRAGYGVGARVYPYTPLAEEARARPDLLVGPSDPTFLAPVVYCSPGPPRPLARALDERFRDVPNVTQSRGGYGWGAPTSALAHRVAAGVDPSDGWQRVVELAGEARLGRDRAETLGSALLVALWHGRYDLAAHACRELAVDEDLPGGVTHGGLSTLADACAELARTGADGNGLEVQRRLQMSAVALQLSAAIKPW